MWLPRSPCRLTTADECFSSSNFSSLQLKGVPGAEDSAIPGRGLYCCRFEEVDSEFHLGNSSSATLAIVDGNGCVQAPADLRERDGDEKRLSMVRAGSEWESWWDIPDGQDCSRRGPEIARCLFPPDLTQV